MLLCINKDPYSAKSQEYAGANRLIEATGEAANAAGEVSVMLVRLEGLEVARSQAELGERVAPPRDRRSTGEPSAARPQHDVA